MTRTNRSIHLSSDEEASLTALAEELGSLSTSGPTVGLPSWRRLVIDLAAGRYIVRRRAADPRPRPRTTPVAAVSADAPPLWWPRGENGLEMFALVDGAMAEECRAMGLSESECGFEGRDEWYVENAGREALPPEGTET